MASLITASQTLIENLKKKVGIILLFCMLCFSWVCGVGLF